MADGNRDDHGGITGAVRGALDATVGRAVGAARDLGENTVRESIDGMEPYLIEETVPRIVEGVTPFLIDQVVPEVIDGVTAHLVDTTVPTVIDSITPELVDKLIPRILEGLEPYLQEQFVPQIVDGLMPMIEQKVAPQLVASLMPQIEAQVAPQLIEALMPKIESEVAPQLVNALLPMIKDEVAPQLVDSLMPKIQNEVVPAVLDDIVDDPRVATLIREQSQGLFIDALERVRGLMARLDDGAENLGRKLTRRPPLTVEQGVELLPGRSQRRAGVVSRGAAFVIDLSLASLTIGITLNILSGLQRGFFADPEGALDWVATAMVLFGVPIYFTFAWWFVDMTVGDLVTGVRITRRNGDEMTFAHSAVRAVLMLALLPVWVVGMLPALFRANRLSWLDKATRSEATYAGRIINRPSEAVQR